MLTEKVEIVLKPINDIIPYWRNPRRNDKTVDALVEEIQAHGFDVPIVIDRNNVVVKGHARLKAAKRLGMEKVPCIVSSASDDVIKADRIADNKIQELSSWDFAKLNLELSRHETPVFNKLFRPDETPVNRDEELGHVDFTPVVLGQEDIGGFEDYSSSSSDVFVPERHEYDYSGGSTFGNDSGHDAGGVAFSGGDAAPQKKTLKTLCPYCGKVVTINL